MPIVAGKGHFLAIYVNTKSYLMVSMGPHGIQPAYLVLNAQTIMMWAVLGTSVGACS
jgi:hypothetical protein